MTESNLPVLILLLPLVGFLINGVVLPLFHRGFAKASALESGFVATFAIGTAFVLAVVAVCGITGHVEPGESPALGSTVYQWLEIGNFKIPFELRIDRLSGVLVLIITGVGSLIHLYSIGYMSHEKCVGRYFSYLNLFCFAMLLLVMGNNLALLFFGWEGVGLCSYLLIGFWYADTEKANAGKKAFIVNRIGDLGFLIGMFLIYKTFGTLTITEIRSAILSGPGISASLATAICLALFVGATGKSAQIPLFVWLPDAMSGPTPVSALIHAATMVTAGVYMIARLNPLFDLSPVAMSVVANIGAFTALMAGTIAIAQKDIKKVLAYSTVSQLGFMFLACGVGAYQTAVFHLMTHAFFKALLFLGSGSVIHACSGEQDMTKMGGLKKHLPHTYLTMLAGSLAISGIPIFSGFFSKDEILYSTIALPGGQSHLFFVGVFTAALTAIYTGRMLAMTFFGSERLDHEKLHHLHESPATMLIPLYVLAVLATFGGLLGVPHLLGAALGHIPHVLSHWLDPVIQTRNLPLVGVQLSLHEGLVMGGSIVLAVSCFILGLKSFKEKFNISQFIPSTAGLQKLWENKYYVDECYHLLVVNPLRKLGDFSANIIDKLVIDNVVVSVGRATRDLGKRVRTIQTGDIQTYALGLGIGLIVLLWMAYKILP
ncbi:MAG: NADH-quinone oxidoreductase subunit L [Bdellovibrionales bacterium GWA2_49_15]|nr:MAG: NADH-quinone oxidoreductase subunit L [Bdellovibrionales bacterium GWA2_49_15]HAZ12181.1 NADH-quinone oxidoreductase subunit L [Bdellovibrionales bacterium]